ncbi:MAG: glycosyltransferase [Acidobacteriota bacterium]
MTSNPLVSVIIIFFNARKFFREATESVFAQTYDNWELLLVDDGSTDAGTDIARHYAEQHRGKVRYFEHKGHQNRGMSASRNLGISNAKGEYIALLDADDVWLPNKLERQVTILSSQPQAAMVYGLSEYWHSWKGNPENGQRDFVPELSVESDTLFDPPALVTLSYPLGSAPTPCPSDLMFRREMAERIGGFEESFQGIYQMYEDIAFLTKVYLAERVFVASECWDKYRLHPDSCHSVVKGAGHYHQVRFFFLKWLKKYLSKQGVEDREIWLAFHKAMEPYWANRHPFANRLAPILNRMFGRNLHLVKSGKQSMVAPTNLKPAIETNDSAAPSYEGYHDIGDCEIIHGWAWDSNHPDLPLEVDIYDGDRLLATVTADEYRKDLHDAGKGSGEHAFSYRVPASLRDGRAHSIRVRVALTDFDLGSTPKEINCELQIVADIRALKNKLRGQAAKIAARTPLGVRRWVIVRWQSLEYIPPAGRVRFGDLRRVTPISRVWGFDRGRPIDRYYIENYLNRHTDDIRGHVLEIGDDTYTYRFGGDRVRKSDVVNVVEGNPKTTILADITCADHIPSDTFDCILFVQTLQLIFDVRAAIKTLHRILKPGGILLATFPGISQISDQLWGDYWCWSFTTLSARRLFAEVFSEDKLKVEAHGNALVAISFLEGLAVEELRQEELDYHDPGYEVLITVEAVKA